MLVIGPQTIFISRATLFQLVETFIFNASCKVVSNSSSIQPIVCNNILNKQLQASCSATARNFMDVKYSTSAIAEVLESPSVKLPVKSIIQGKYEAFSLL